jgi:PAS domain-containing protein
MWGGQQGTIGNEGQFGGYNGDQQQQAMNDMNPINAMNTILQQMAAEQQYQAQQDQSMPYGQAEMQQQLHEQLQQQLQEQLQQQLQQQLNAAAEAEAKSRMISRPDEHFLTVAVNGTILGATETVTGLPADSLLMTSIFDSVHHEDLIGLQTVYTRFWEKGHPEVEAYFRRRGAEDEWVWLVAKVVSFIDDPVPGLVLQESMVHDEGTAELISRTIRVPALLVNQVEEAYIAKQRRDNGEAEPAAEQNPDMTDDLRTLFENAAANGIDIDSNGLSALLENGKNA